MTSPVKVLAALGTITTLIALLSIGPNLWSMSVNLTNPNYPMTEVAINSINGVVYALVPTSLGGMLLYAASELQ